MSKTGSKIVMIIDWILLVINLALLIVSITLVSGTIKVNNVAVKADSGMVTAFAVIGGIQLAVSLAFNVLLTMGLNQESKQYCRVWVFGHVVFLVINVILLIVSAITNRTALGLVGIIFYIYRAFAIYIVTQYYRSIHHNPSSIGQGESYTSKY